METKMTIRQWARTEKGEKIIRNTWLVVMGLLGLHVTIMSVCGFIIEEGDSMVFVIGRGIFYALSAVMILWTMLCTILFSE